MATNNINTEDVRVYAKALRLGNLRNNCSEIIHQAQIDKPSYLDFNHSAGVTKTQLKQLRELVWLDQNYNIIFMGPSGTGKTFMTAGLIRDAVMKGYKAQFITMDSLINILRMKDSSTSAMCAYNKMLKCQLLLIVCPLSHTVPRS